MRPSGRISSSCIRIGLYQGFGRVHERECALFMYMAPGCTAISHRNLIGIGEERDAIVKAAGHRADAHRAAFRLRADGDGGGTAP